MDSFILYTVKSSICLATFYICVKAFLSNETFFCFNRGVLLSGMFTCFLLPLIELNTKEVSVFQSPILLLEDAVSGTGLATPDASAETSVYIPNGVASRNAVGLGTILIYVYFIGLAIYFLRLFLSVYSTTRVIKRGKKKKYSGYTLVLIPENIVPFSWRQYIVLSESDYRNNPHEIIVHELAHIVHRHSLDLIYMELILLLQWFNPAVHFLKNELKDVHEYQADMKVLRIGVNATKYQLLLVKKAVGTSSYTLANSFNHSKIKKRITMMLKEKSSKWARLKLLLLLPLGALAVFAFARPEVNEPLRSLVEYESTTILPEKEEFKENILQEPEKKQVTVEKSMKKQSSEKKPDNYYTIDGKRATDAEFKKMKENSIPLSEPYYIPFAKGKVVKVHGFFSNGLVSPPTYHEMFVDGKAPDRSHVDFIVDGVKYGFDEKSYLVYGIKFKDRAKAEEEAQKRGTKMTEFQIVKKDGTMDTGPWYVVPYIRPDTLKEAPGPPPVKKKVAPDTPPTPPVSNKK